VQVHDARLAALMQAYGLKHILTLNQPDHVPARNRRLQTPRPRRCSVPSTAS
jgi:predicted nucleic acid-binding protein